ncbi:MAG: hypothetical protein WC850_00575 [Candidatus Gracilibacteria bacterium]
MNRYEKMFFSKFIQEGSEVKYVVHEHFVVILDRLIITFLLFVFIPCFLYFISGRFQQFVPFNIFEIYLILVYIKIIYDIFDWYNDVWIITEKSVIDLKWALLYIKMNSVDFESIEGIEIEQKGLFDKILGKGTLIIHKIGDEFFRLKEAKIPFEALEEIERIKDEKEAEPENEEKEKFELILEALSGVVNEYLEVSHLKKKNEETINSKLEEVVNKEGTIDLR